MLVFVMVNIVIHSHEKCQMLNFDIETCEMAYSLGIFRSKMENGHLVVDSLTATPLLSEGH